MNYLKFLLVNISQTMIWKKIFFELLFIFFIKKIGENSILEISKKPFRFLVIYPRKFKKEYQKFIKKWKVLKFQ